MRNVLFAAIGFLCVISLVFAASAPTYREGAAELGIGGATSLYGYNSSALIYNPALLNRSNFHLDVLNLGIVFDSQILNLLQFISNHQNEFSHFDSLDSNADKNRQLQDQFLNSMEKYDNQWFKIGVTPLIGATWKHWGFAIVNQTYPEVQLERGIFNPMVAVQGVTNVFGYLGYGNETTLNVLGKDRNIEYGITGKVITEREVTLKRVSATKVTSPGDLVDQVKNDFNEKKNGAGIDLGLTNRVTDKWDVAAVMHDAIGVYDKHYITPNLVLGTKYALGELLMPSDEIVNHWIAIGEIQDLLNSQGTSFFYKWHLGSELSVGNHIILRGGFNQGYPTVGAGLNLYVFKIDYAFYGEELGLAPGQLPSYKHFLQLSFGW